jgi:hypothetical protein
MNIIEAVFVTEFDARFRVLYKCNNGIIILSFCGLVVRLPGYISRGLGFDSWRYQIFLVSGLNRGPLSLVRINEVILERKSSDSGLEN